MSYQKTANLALGIISLSSHLIALTQILAPCQDGQRRHFLIHAENARPHCAKMVTLLLDRNFLRRALHLPYSLDLAPSDFRLFGHLKGVLHGSSFDEPDELLSVIQEILREIDSETLDAVFQ
jgi:hypothetical protein